MSSLTAPMVWFLNVVDPWYWVTISASLFVLFLLGFSPAFSPSSTDEKYKISDHLKIKLRQIAWFNLVFVCLIGPVIIFALASLKATNIEALSYVFMDVILQSGSQLWVIPLLAVLLGFGSSWFLNRHLSPWISATKKRWEVRQSGDELSDIRLEKNKMKTKDFLPNKHYKEGYFFWGLDSNNVPIYDDFATWNTRHFRFVGPTQTGKGVEIGIALDQAIRNGNTVFFIDPKPDKHARLIMKKACSDTGRMFVELDLRPQGKGRYEPFLGGDERQARSRLSYILGLQDTGTDGDFYKSTERRIIDKIFSDWDRRLHSLKGILSDDKYFNDVKRSLNYIDEWLRISTFKVSKDKRGFAVDKCFENQAVVYIRGDLDDAVLNKACTVLLMEICQEAKRLYENNQRKGPVTLIIDEVAFLINEQIADSLATVAGFDMNIGLAYQSEGDLLNLKDKTLNAQAIATRVKVNCKNSMYYMAADAETAKVMAEESGEIFKNVTRSQSVTIGRHLEETWENRRDLHKVDEYLITTNQAKMLPERVAVLYRPNMLAEVCHTCWIPVQNIEETKPIENNEPIEKEVENKKLIEDLPRLAVAKNTNDIDKTNPENQSDYSAETQSEDQPDYEDWMQSQDQGQPEDQPDYEDWAQSQDQVATKKESTQLPEKKINTSGAKPITFDF